MKCTTLLKRLGAAALISCIGMGSSALAQPANGSCTSIPAQFTFPGTGGTITQTAAELTGWSYSGTACAGSSGGVVYMSFTPSTATRWRFSTCGTSPAFDSVLSIHTACPTTTSNYSTGSSSTSCNDTGPSPCTSSTSQFDTTILPAGVPVIIRVARWNSLTIPTGGVTVTITDLATFGACCNGTTCTFVANAAACGAGVFQGPGTTCTPNLCAGACCSTTGTCTLTTAAGCVSPSTFNGLGTTCSPNPCVGACCSTTGTCTSTTAAACVSPSVFQGLSTVCSPTPCDGATAPANSKCPNAVAFTGSGFTVDGTNLDAATDPSPAVCVSSSRDVWYTFTPDATANYSATMCNTQTGTLDTVLSIHTACPIVSNNWLLAGACNDDGCSGSAGPSAISSVSLTGGTTYWIRVARFGTSSNGGPFRLVVGAVVGACCDGNTGACTIATQAACGGAPNTWTLGGVCSSSACDAVRGACCNLNTGVCTLAFTAACVSPDTFQGIGTTCTVNPCPQPSGACCNATTGACTVGAASACTSPNAFQGNNSTCTPVPCIANDVCANAIALSDGVPATGVLNGATASPIATLCTGSERDVYYSFTSAMGGTYSVTLTPTGTVSQSLSIGSTCGTSFDDTLFCVTVSNTPTTSSNITLAAGESIVIRVADFATTTASTFSIVVNTVITGACCNINTGTCQILQPAQCLTSSGLNYLGNNTVCGPTSCDPSGACCNTTDGTCLVRTTVGCTAINGSYLGNTTTCTPTNPCPQPAACCLANGVCILTTSATFCTSNGGTVNAATSCTPSPCAAPANTGCASAIALTVNVWQTGNNNLAATGASVPAATCQSSTSKDMWYTFIAPASDNYGVTTCGSTQDTVIQVYTITDCAQTSTYTAVACDDDTCNGGAGEPSVIPGVPASSTSGLASNIPSVAMTGGSTYYIRVSSFLTTATGGNFQVRVTNANLGSCCAPAGTCTVTLAAGCMDSFTLGGVCSPNTCPQPVNGRCCVGSRCVVGIDSAACDALAVAPAGRVFSIGATDCNAPSVFNNPCCFADYNKQGGVGVQDIFDFLAGWFANSPNANVGGSGGVPGVQSIFDFLAAWFAGGCV